MKSCLSIVELGVPPNVMIAIFAKDIFSRDFQNTIRLSRVPMVAGLCSPTMGSYVTTEVLCKGSSLRLAALPLIYIVVDCHHP